jgi:hypothetical protein
LLNPRLLLLVWNGMEWNGSADDIACTALSVAGSEADPSPGWFRARMESWKIALSPLFPIAAPLLFLVWIGWRRDEGGSCDDVFIVWEQL